MADSVADRQNARRILVVEDDAAIRVGLAEVLTKEGYAVEFAVDGEDARERLADSTPHLVVLDLMLPRLDGLGVLRWLRRHWASLPVLIVSAKGRERDKVEGLRAGADDYLSKPFGLAELVARVEALLRRALGPDELVRAGDLEIDETRGDVSIAGERIALSRIETAILVCLARRVGNVVSRDEIRNLVWGTFADTDGRAVDYHILHLRRKIEEDPAQPRRLVTHRGRGYELRSSDGP